MIILHRVKSGKGRNSLNIGYTRGEVDEIDSIETITKAMRLAKVEDLSSVILELTPGKSWQYSRSGEIMAQGQETSVLVARSKGTRCALCVANEEGIWSCSILDTDGLSIKGMKTRL